ncbi:unnamed protein product, partial [Rotaria magnacalcarata]
ITGDAHGDVDPRITLS